MDYKVVKYSEIGKIRSGKRLPKGYTVSENVSNNKYIRVRDINNGSIDSSIVQYITDEAAEKLERYRVKTRDVIISVVGTVGAIAQIDESLNGAYLTENCDNLQVDESLCLKDYLKYYLLSEDGNKEIVANTVGSTQPKLPIYGIENFNIKLPSVDNQKKIVRLLNSIDNKIKLNNKINSNLCDLSNCNYLEFIKSLKNNDDCNYKDLKELGTIIMGQSPKGESYNYEQDGLPLINGAADYEEGYLKAQKYTSNPIKICKKDDLLFCIRATIGLLVNCDKEYCLGRGVAAVTNINPLYREYAYHIIDSSMEDFKRMATGSVIVGISRDNIENIPIKVPSKEEIEKYHSIEKPIFDKIEKIRIENLELKKLRDILLPKIMNGEIDLDNVEI